jgi:hypothetical protein
VGGVYRPSVVLSSNGIDAHVYTSTTMSITTGNAYFMGWSFIPGTSVTLFLNDQFETRVLNDVGAAVIASIHPATASLCVGRLDRIAATLPVSDFYFYFAGLSNLRWNSSVGLSCYRFIQPMMLYNTDLSGT